MSDGEKIRLMILVMSHQYELPLVLLDNPLDIELKEVLVNALNDLNGSMILISHDEYLINAIGDVN